MSSEVFDVVDPATDAVVGHAPRCSAGELDRVMGSAQAALAGWAAPGADRVAMLRAAAGRVRAAADELAALVTAEQGKPLAEARLEALGVAAKLEHYTAMSVDEPVIHDDDARHTQLTRRPVGVVAAITPWNYPIGIAAIKIAPALRAGATVVWKPSPFTPLAARLVTELINEELPPGVLNIVTGDGDLGERVVAHPVPRKISFTGSTAVGKAVARSAADDLKRVTLELGGNDAALLLAGFDAGRMAERVFWGAFSNNGQVCVAIKRVYAPRHLYEEVVEALTAHARRAVVGRGTEQGTQLGPLATAPQLARVVQLAESARAGGARFTTGGNRVGEPGYFFEPTIVADIAPDAPLVTEEQFGPILPVVAYDDLADAIQQVNASPFGLGGSVWDVDVDHAAAVAAQLECGTAWVNTHLAVGSDLPLSGMKQSGIGIENGSWGLESYTEPQLVYRNRRP